MNDLNVSPHWFLEIDTWQRGCSYNGFSPGPIFAELVDGHGMLAVCFASVKA